MVFVIIQDEEVEFVAADDFEESDLSDIEVSCGVIPRILSIITRIIPYISYKMA